MDLPSNDETRWQVLLDRVNKSERTFNTMHTVQIIVGALTSWIVALMALAGAYQSEVMYFFGLVLVIARLIQELPKAVKEIKKWFKGGPHE